jgi:hypothetical protein
MLTIDNIVEEWVVVSSQAVATVESFHMMRRPLQKTLKWCSPFLLSLLLACMLLGIGGRTAHASARDSASVARSTRTLAASSQLTDLRSSALYLQQQLWQEATKWSNQHTYYDNYDHKTYNLGYEYQAIAYYPTQNLLDSASTVADYQYIIGQLNGWLADFAAYTANFNDQTPYNRVHETDLQLLQQNSDLSDRVVVISLTEQAMRVYQNGKLLKAFQVVTGMPGHASLPGSWWIENKATNTTFLSGKKPGEQGYYPPTPIAYALQYHSAGYFIHQSWWRGQYGPYNQFPHFDPHGTSFAYEGSHGCVNMSTADVKWLYNFVQLNTTKVIIY